LHASAGTDQPWHGIFDGCERVIFISVFFVACCVVGLLAVAFAPVKID